MKERISHALRFMISEHIVDLLPAFSAFKLKMIPRKLLRYRIRSIPCIPHKKYFVCDHINVLMHFPLVFLQLLSSTLCTGCCQGTTKPWGTDFSAYFGSPHSFGNCQRLQLMSKVSTWRCYLPKLSSQNPTELQERRLKKGKQVMPAARHTLPRRGKPAMPPLQRKLSKKWRSKWNFLSRKARRNELFF